MKNKLTLRLDEKLIKEAKEYAKSKKTSVSQLVADYFKAIESRKSEENPDYSPVTSSLVGILKDRDISEEDYKSYLEEKHLK